MSSTEGLRTTSANVERRLAAILHADVQGYSRLIGEDEPGTLRVLGSYLEKMRTLVQRHGGRAVGSRGDSLLAEFPSAVEAVQCAVEIQQALAVSNADLPVTRRVEFRIGINLGEIVVEGEQIHGEGINIAVRLEGLAEAGGILLSEVVYDQVKNRLPLGYEYVGERLLKNIAGPVRVYRVGHHTVTGKRGLGTPPSWRRQVRVSMVPVLLAVGVGAVLLTPSVRSKFRAGEKPVAPIGKPSIAVLPFVNLSGDPEQQYFSDGMTEDLIGALSKISGVFVVAHNSVLPYGARPANLAQVSRELGVRYVVDGSVRKAGDRIRITAQLLDASTGHSLWNERYDRELKDIFSVQDEIVRQVVLDLGVVVEKAEFDRVRRIPTENLNAYDSFLRGIYELRRALPGDARARSIEARREAARMFERAIELDPKFASAYALLGLLGLYDSLTHQVSRVGPPRIAELADKALSADESDAIAHALSAWVWWQKGDRERAIAEAKLVIALAPNDADGRATVADLFNSLGMPSEGLTEIQQAMLLNPHYPPWYLTVLGMAYTEIGRYQEAIDAHKKALLQNPDIPSSRRELVSLYRAVGLEEEARNEEEELRRLNAEMLADILPVDPRGQASSAETMPTPADASGEHIRDLLRESRNINR
jgi:adenylate cyclase